MHIKQDALYLRITKRLQRPVHDPVIARHAAEWAQVAKLVHQRSADWQYSHPVDDLIWSVPLSTS